LGDFFGLFCWDLASGLGSKAALWGKKVDKLGLLWVDFGFKFVEFMLI